MTVGKHTAKLADLETIENIDVSFLVEEDTSKKDPVAVDPFLTINLNKYVKSKPIHKKYEQLKKQLSGIKGAETKYKDPEQVNGYSLFNVVEPPYDLFALASLYDENSTLHATVDARVMNTVGLGFGWEPSTKAKKQIEKGHKNEATAERVRNAHQKEIERLEQLFESFNIQESLMETLIRVWLDTLTLGNGYLEIGRTKTGSIGYIGHVPATLVRVRRERDGFVQTAFGSVSMMASPQLSIFFRNFGDKKTTDPINGDRNPNELIHFKLYTPNNNFYGVPPSVSALSAIVGDKFAKEFNIDYFENKAIPRYAIVLKGVKLSEKSKREVIQYFRNEVKGKNHGTLVIPLPPTIGGGAQADVKFEKLETDVQEASFDKYRKANRDEVVIAYRVPPTKIGILDNANLAVSRDADKTFKTQVVGPDQAVVENKVNLIVKEFTDLFCLKLEQLDIIDEDLRSRIHDRYARIEALTPNEVRQAIGKQPIEGGDKMLPYPIKTGYQAGQPWPSLVSIEGQKPAAGGAPIGNQNSGSPPKSGQDNGSNRSNANATGTNNERGQTQDAKGVRERSV